MSLSCKKLKDFSILFFPSTAFSPTFSLAALFVSWSIQLMSFRPSSNADCTSATMSSTWWTKETRKSHISANSNSRSNFLNFILKSFIKYHLGLAVFSERGFDKQSSQSKAQGAVGVTDTQLPAGSAALQKNNNICTLSTHPCYSTSGCVSGSSVSIHPQKHVIKHLTKHTFCSTCCRTDEDVYAEETCSSVCFYFWPIVLTEHYTLDNEMKIDGRLSIPLLCFFI